MPKVSIILPTYNGKKYLPQAVDSILAQTFSDWELILVDDCSTDGTSDLVDQYEQLDSRIHAVHNAENQKLPSSLNIGFAKARGRYLTWTSDDNLYLPDAVAVMADLLDRYPEVPMVRGNMYFMDESGEITGESKSYSDKIMYDFNCMGACFLYRREVKDTVGDYDPDMFCVEDYDYWLRILEAYGTIRSIDRVLYKYRRHENSLSETRKKQVGEQLTRLRMHHLDRILEVLCNNSSEICRIYYDMRNSGKMSRETVDKFCSVIPELGREVPILKERCYLIFGAGQFGEEAARRLGGQAVAFADNHPAKVGTRKCGLKILSFSDAVQLSRIRKFWFIVAVAEKTIYEMVMQLQSEGIKEYSVFLRNDFPDQN